MKLILPVKSYFIYIFDALNPNFILYFFSKIEIAHLRCKNVEVACSICPADQLACIFSHNTRIFGHPHHRGGEPVSVQAKPIVSFTLLLTVALA